MQDKTLEVYLYSATQSTIIDYIERLSSCDETDAYIPGNQLIFQSPHRQFRLYTIQALEKPVTASLFGQVRCILVNTASDEDLRDITRYLEGDNNNWFQFSTAFTYHQCKIVLMLCQSGATKQIISNDTITTLIAKLTERCVQFSGVFSVDLTDVTVIKQSLDVFDSISVNPNLKLNQVLLMRQQQPVVLINNHRDTRQISDLSEGYNPGMSFDKYMLLSPQHQKHISPLFIFLDNVFLNESNEAYEDFYDKKSQGLIKTAWEIWQQCQKIFLNCHCIEIKVILITLMAEVFARIYRPKLTYLETSINVSEHDIFRWLSFSDNESLKPMLKNGIQYSYFEASLAQPETHKQVSGYIDTLRGLSLSVLWLSRLMRTASPDAFHHTNGLRLRTMMPEKIRRHFILHEPQSGAILFTFINPIVDDKTIHVQSMDISRTLFHAHLKGVGKTRLGEDATFFIVFYPNRLVCERFLALSHWISSSQIHFNMAMMQQAIGQERDALYTSDANTLLMKQRNQFTSKEMRQAVTLLLHFLLFPTMHCYQSKGTFCSKLIIEVYQALFLYDEIAAFAKTIEPQTKHIDKLGSYVHRFFALTPNERMHKLIPQGLQVSSDTTGPYMLLKSLETDTKNFTHQGYWLTARH